MPGIYIIYLFVYIINIYQVVHIYWYEVDDAYVRVPGDNTPTQRKHIRASPQF